MFEINKEFGFSITTDTHVLFKTQLIMILSMVRVTRSLVLYVCFVDRCLFFCTFSFGHCVVCTSSNYGF